MSSIRSREEFRQWLDDKPHEFSILVASRAAMRTIPVLARVICSPKSFDRPHSSDAIFMLSLLRSNAVALLYGNFPEIEISNAAQFSASYLNTVEASVASSAFEDAHNVAAENAVSAIAYASYAAASPGVYAETVSDSISAAAQVDDDWDSISADVSPRISEIGTEEIIMSSLWTTRDEPDWLVELWQILKNQLAQYHEEHWHVWTDWWEDRRDGKPYNIEMEREIVLIPHEDWEKGPAHVNAMIAEIRARYATKDIPADNPFAPRFETVENRVVLRADTPDVLPREEQAGLYDALREQVVELCGLCPVNSNRYGAQGKAVARFLAALGEDYGSMRLSALWLAGQKMRRFARADDAKRAAADPEDDPMEPDQSALFAEVVMTYNVFSTGEAGLKARDEKGRDPATLSPDVTEEARAVRGAVVETPVLFDEDVPLVLDDVIEEAIDPVPGIAARGVVLTRETFENLLGALARKARTEPRPEPSEIGKGAKAAIGAGVVGGSAVVASAFIAVYEATLIAFAAKLPASPVWIGIIKSIVAKWDKFI